ncbi:PDZ domain-containing protein [Mariniblastus sp.]|nr:PDZ domain-containing protein [Mariniblastus sp.]
MANTDETRFGKVKKACLNHPILFVVILVTTSVIGLANFTNAIKVLKTDGTAFVAQWYEETAENEQPVENGDDGKKPFEKEAVVELETRLSEQEEKLREVTSKLLEWEASIDKPTKLESLSDEEYYRELSRRTKKTTTELKKLIQNASSSDSVETQARAALVGRDPNKARTLRFGISTTARRVPGISVSGINERLEIGIISNIIPNSPATRVLLHDKRDFNGRTEVRVRVESLEPGDKIESINGVTPKTEEQFVRLIRESPRAMKFTVTRAKDKKLFPGSVTLAY